MAVGKLVSLFLVEGVPSALIVGEVSNWTGKAFKIPRNLLKQSANREELQKAGVYLLFGKSEDSPDEDAVYIGEAEEVHKRLLQHDKTEFWTDAVVFGSKDDNLNKAHVKYLESKLYDLVLAAKRYQLVNSTRPTCPALSEPERAVMTEFLANLRLLLNTMGYKALEPLINPEEQQWNLYFIKGARGADGRAVVTHEGVVVLEGSRVADPVVPSISQAFVNTRQTLMDRGVIDDKLVFTRDYLFSSPSTAAAVVMGRNANGRTELKDSEGVTLAEKEVG